MHAWPEKLPDHCLWFRLESFKKLGLEIIFNHVPESLYKIRVLKVVEKCSRKLRKEGRMENIMYVVIMFSVK